MQICIIIPCYNEAKRLNTEKILGYAETQHPFSIHFCFVNDGSSDDTMNILYTLQKQSTKNNIHITSLSNNEGKAEAVRLGMLAMYEQKKFDILGYWDADLATPLEEIDIMYKILLQYPSYLGILGLRLSRLGANIKRQKLRHYIGRVFATLVSNILNVALYDSQCGAKILKQNLIPICFKEKFVSKWLFDVEILLRLQQFLKHYPINGHSSIETALYEMPLMSWQDIKGSKIKWHFFFIASIHLFSIFIHYKYKNLLKK